MVTLNEVVEILEQFTSDAKSMFEESKANFNLDEAMRVSGDVDEVRNVVAKIQNVMIGNIPTGVSIPRVSKYVSASGEGGVISVVNIKITNKINSDKKFSFATSITQGNADEKVFDFMLAVYSELIEDELANRNIARVNDVLMQLTAEAGVDYSVRVVSPMGNDGKKLSAISDDGIVFVADPIKVFQLENILVLFESATDLISEEVIQADFNKLVDELRTAQTTPQLVGIRGGLLVSYVCDISKRGKAFTLIKKVCNKNIEKQTSAKDYIAYFAKEDVFALVEQKKGVKSVLLSPFNVDTFLKVDSVSVLDEIG